MKESKEEKIHREEINMMYQVCDKSLRIIW